MHDFTRRKFLDLRLEQQHKKCAEFLRNIHDKLARGQDANEDIAHCQELRRWMEQPSVELATLGDIADAYHIHLRLAKQSLKEHNLLPPINTQDRESGEQQWPIAVFLDRIRSAHNVGSIFRTVEAFGLGSIHLSPGVPSPLNKQVKDTAMGSADWVSWKEEASLDSLPHPIIALETSTWAVPIHEFLFPDAFTLAVGNEEEGCSEQTLKLADFIISIPLRGRKNSLNVANAFAIAAAEINRQRQKALND